MWRIKLLANTICLQGVEEKIGVSPKNLRLSNDSYTVIIEFEPLFTVPAVSKVVARVDIADVDNDAQEVVLEL